MRNNSKTNFIHHDCSSTITKAEPLIHFVKPVEMSLSVRQQLSDKIALLIAERPTLSINCATDFANKILDVCQSDILRSGRPFNFNFHRNTISSKIIEMGMNQKKENLEMLNSSLPFVTIIFDHWSQHGVNFLGAIA